MELTFERLPETSGGVDADGTRPLSREDIRFHMSSIWDPYLRVHGSWIHEMRVVPRGIKSDRAKTDLRQI